MARQAAAEAFGGTSIASIRAGDVEDWQAELRKPRMIHGSVRTPSAATVNGAVEDLRRMLNWAVSREYIPSSPFNRGGVSIIKLDREDNRRNRRISLVARHAGSRFEVDGERWAVEVIRLFQYFSDGHSARSREALQ